MVSTLEGTRISKTIALRSCPPIQRSGEHIAGCVETLVGVALHQTAAVARSPVKRQKVGSNEKRFTEPISHLEELFAPATESEKVSSS